MNALFRLLAFGGFAASVRRRARVAGLQAAFAVAALIPAAVGAGFLTIALYQWLRWHFVAPVASAILGGGFVGVALLVALVGYIALRRERRPAPPSLDHTAGLAALGPVAAAASRIPPAVLAAAVAGFVYGMRGKSK
ncbi:hypothetical protein STAQ_09130 [Allostella sp. ATCC 35155]|nr:hypothetical protein STAQ_09130 [Stella sp. ATCC 35155]